jgi:hypothetical protein
MIGVFLVQLPIHWVVMLIQYFGTSTDDSGSGSPFSFYYYLAAIPPDVLENFGRAFFAPFAFITAGANIAPKFKFPTGIALAVALGVIYGVGATIIADEITGGLYTPERWLRLGISLLLYIAGIAVGLFQAHKAEHQSVTRNSPDRV